MDKIEFVGYDALTSWSQVVKYRRVQNKQGTQVQVVLDKTPFYAESGGQIGDTGRFDIYSNNGGEMTSVPVLDTRKENNLTIHILADQPGLDELLQQVDGSYASGNGVNAQIDAHRRELTEDNHSATHLMHSALREVLGAHVAQKGSYVGPDTLRFDFSHFGKMTDEELERVEVVVNEKIRQNIPLYEQRNVPIEQAKGMGATALFGEKYGDFVRVITFDPNYSVELCGGTHVRATGQIRLFKITSEGSVSTGIRRIEAKTAEGAFALLNQQEATLNELKDLLKAPKDVVKAVQSLLDERNALLKKVEALENEQVQQVKEALLTRIAPLNVNRNGAPFVLVEQVNVPTADALKQLAYDLKARVDNLALVLGANVNGKPQLAVLLPESLTLPHGQGGRGLNAGQVVKDLAKHIKGGGGGQPFFATAGGTDASGLDAALAQGRALLS